MGLQLSCLDTRSAHSPFSKPAPATPAAATPPELPDVVLHSIVLRLTSIVDLVAFGSVCRDWRSVAKASLVDLVDSRAPMLAIPSSNFSIVARLYSLTDNRLYIAWPLALGMEFVGQSHGYFITRDVFRHTIPFVWNPFTGAGAPFPAAPCPFNFAILSAPPTSPDCLLLLFGGETLQYLPLGDSHSHWTKRHYRKDISFETATVVKNKVYAASRSGKLWMVMRIRQANRWDRYCCAFSEVVTMWPPYPLPVRYPSHQIIAELDGEILLVCLKAGVYRLDFSKRKWVKAESLGDRALFVSRYGYQFRHGSRSEGIERNTVYWASDDRPDWHTPFSLNGQQKAGVPLYHSGKPKFWVGPPCLSWISDATPFFTEAMKSRV